MTKKIRTSRTPTASFMPRFMGFRNRAWLIADSLRLHRALFLAGKLMRAEGIEATPSHARIGHEIDRQCRMNGTEAAGHEETRRAFSFS
jgi:hypothetical protein